MPIDWDTVTPAETLGEELLELMRELFPIPRSLTGDGVRETLRVLAREVPLELVETPTGTPIFDWVAPREWKLRGAWIEGPSGERIVDAADSPLHVLGYSTPVDAVLSLEELRAHVFTHEDPELVPYRTSYWTEQWGFCMSRAQLESLEPGDYHAVVDADARRRLADLGRADARGRPRVGVPAQHVRLPPGARERQPLRDRRPVGAREDAGPPAARAHLPRALEPRDAGAALLARSGTSTRSTGCRTGS